MNRHLARFAPVAAAAIIVAAGTLIAGPLNPPAGPVGSTMKTISDVEPRIAINATNTPGDADSVYRITQPGSYYLTGNLNGVSGKHGIEIAADDVSIDLKGYVLTGIRGALSGIALGTLNVDNVVISNGTVRDWPGSGIDVGTNNSYSSTITDIHAISNTTTGFCLGQSAAIRRCVADSNGEHGIDASGSGTVVSDCQLLGNGGKGITGVYGGLVTNCVAYYNTEGGIQATHSIISNCNATFNQQNGFTLGDQCTISGCLASTNTLAGIEVGAGCTIAGNTCDQNGNGGIGPGILLTGASNRVESNSCSTNTRGIRATSAGNLIFKNSLRSNFQGNFDLVAGNHVGLIVAPATSGIITGNGPGAGFGNTDPNANWVY